MSKKETITINNPNYDFCQIQNYVIQLVAEGRLTASAFLLYSFYKSLNGFNFIRVGYRYISENTGICTGNIKKCNELLIACGLISTKSNGSKRAFHIDLTPDNLIPRRVLKTVQNSNSDEECSSDEQPVHEMNSFSAPCSSGEHIHRLPQERVETKITTTPRKNPRKKSELDTKKKVDPVDAEFTREQADFIDLYVSRWKIHNGSKYYTKNDFSEVRKLGDLEDAKKYIEILWCLDDVDLWVKNGDHTLTVFVKEYLAGKLQDMFPKTIYAVESMPA